MSQFRCSPFSQTTSFGVYVLDNFSLQPTRLSEGHGGIYRRPNLSGSVLCLL